METEEIIGKFEQHLRHRFAERRTLVNYIIIWRLPNCRPIFNM